MNIFTFLTEGRGFTYKGASYTTGGSKTEKKYYKNGKEITEVTYNKALKNYHLEKDAEKEPETPVKAPAKRQKKTSEEPIPTEDTPKKRTRKNVSDVPPTEEPKTPLITKKETFTPTLSLGKRLDALQEKLHENIFVPSDKVGDDSVVENLERINKMLPMMQMGVHVSGINSYSVQLMCNTISKMATDWPILFDDEFPALSFFGTTDEYAKSMENYVTGEFASTKEFKKYAGIREDVQEKYGKVLDTELEAFKDIPSDESEKEQFFKERRPLNEVANKIYEGIHTKFDSEKFGGEKMKDVVICLTSSFPFSKRYQSPENTKDFLKTLDSTLSKQGMDTKFSENKEITDLLNASPKEANSLTKFSKLFFEHILSKEGNRGKLLSLTCSIDPQKVFNDHFKKQTTDIEKYIGYQSKREGLFLHSQPPFYGSIHVNPKYLGSKKNKTDFHKYENGTSKELLKGFANSEMLVGYEKRTGLSHITIHEFAHALVYKLNLIKTKDESYDDGMKKLSFIEGSARKLKTPMKINGKAYSIIDPSTIFGEIFHNNQGKLEKEISKYGATNPDEMVSEAFVQAYCSKKPSQLAKDIVNVCKYLMKLNVEYDMKERGETE